MEQSKAMESIRTISKTVANLSEASQNLGQSIDNLAYDYNLAEKIQVDIEYVKWISGFVNDRAKCVLENVCGRKGLNQLSEDELSAWLNYDYFCQGMDAEEYQYRGCHHRQGKEALDSSICRHR